MMDEKDTLAVVRLLKYAKSEAERLGLDEAAWLLDMPILSIAQARSGAHHRRRPVRDSQGTHRRSVPGEVRSAPAH